MQSDYVLYAKKIINSKKIQTAAGFFVTVALGTYLFYKVIDQWQFIAQYPFTFNIGYLALSIIPFSIAHLLVAFNWGLILYQFGVSVGFRRNLKVFSYSNAMTNLPGGWWYIVGRVYGYSQNDVPKHIVVMATALERTLLIVAGIIISLMAIPLISLASLETDSVWLNIWVLLIPLFFLSILLTPTVLNSVVNFFIRKFADRDIKVILDISKLARFLAIDLLILLVSGVVMWCLVNVFYPQGFNWQVVGITSSFCMSMVVSNLLFWLPQFGVKDGILAVAMSVFIPAPIAVATTILVRIWTIVGNLLWLVISSKL